MNLRECVWEIRYRIIIKTILQEKERIIAALKFGSYASSYENSLQAKSSSGQGMGKLAEIFSVEPD